MADGESNPPLQTINQANGLFTFDIYKALATEPGNLFISPLSIQVILALVFLGARGNTAKQIARGLRVPEDRSVVENGVNTLMNNLKEQNDVTLEIANKIFLMTGFDIKEEFKQSAIKFMAGIETVDFADENSARKTINDWVETQTHNKIKDLIPQGVLDAFTRLVLVNAIYFKGDWLKQFDKKRTLPMPFYGFNATTTDVDMMYIEERFRYADISELKSQVVLLPYKGDRLSMMIVLPRDANGLNELEKKLTNFSLQDVTSRLQKEDVHVYLPKFKMTYSKELNDALVKLGISEMFAGEAANLTGISDTPLTVTKVLHKSFIEVNEEGTEAAAATAVIIAVPTSLGFAPPPPIIFKADHPFLFFILDHRTNVVFFVGRYSSPPA